MLKHMFVTGTDTAVGKTVVARAIAAFSGEPLYDDRL